MSSSTSFQDAAAAAQPAVGQARGLGDTAEAGGDVSGLSGRRLLEVVAGGVAARRAAEVAEMVAAVEWATRHGHPRDERDPMTTPGGEGTPGVREYALPELAMARGEHTLRTRTLVADGLDLLHRLPLTWARAVAGECDLWVARRVAVLSRALAADVVGLVDAAVSRVVGGHAPATVLEVAAAKVIEADPEGHAARRERARRERYVRLSRADEFGFRHVIAKVTAGDAVWVDAMLDRVADILALTHGHDNNHDQLRSLAFGWLARPADLLKLLLDHADPDGLGGRKAGESDGLGGRVAGESDGLGGRVAGERSEPRIETTPETTLVPVWLPGHAEATVERLASLSARQLAAMRGRGTVFVHLTDRSLLAQAGVARVEGQGPFLVQALAELLGHGEVVLKPVIDHRVRYRGDAYEHPEAVKDRVWTQTGGDVFPFSPRTATRDGVDFDHCQPFQPTGLPGQTGDHNAGPLRRRHHRWKTFGGYRCRQAGPGRYLWQTPHGMCYLRDADGTRRLSEAEADLLLTAPPGLDVYPSKLTLADDYEGAPTCR